jgi:hypothetical protein
MKAGIIRAGCSNLGVQDSRGIRVQGAELRRLRGALRHSAHTAEFVICVCASMPLCAAAPVACRAPAQPSTRRAALRRCPRAALRPARAHAGAGAQPGDAASLASFAAAAPPAPPKSTSPAVKEHTSLQPQPAVERVDWRRSWYAVAALDALEPDVPTAVTVMGQRIALWRDAEGIWRALRDECPHRLAPLSEGRVAEDGTLQVKPCCSRVIMVSVVLSSDAFLFCGTVLLPWLAVWGLRRMRRRATGPAGRGRRCHAQPSLSCSLLPDAPGAGPALAVPRCRPRRPRGLDARAAAAHPRLGW